jgi:hypothetical protein
VVDLTRGFFVLYYKCWRMSPLSTLPLPAQSLIVTLLASFVVAMAGSWAEAVLGLGLIATGLLWATKPPGVPTVVQYSSSPLDRARALRSQLELARGVLTREDFDLLQRAVEDFLREYFRIMLEAPARRPRSQNLEFLADLRNAVLDMLTALGTAHGYRDLSVLSTVFGTASFRMLQTTAVHSGLPPRSFCGRPAPWDAQTAVWGHDRYTMH